MKIIIELPSWLGDTVMATPAIHNIIDYFNNPDITLVGSSVAISTLANHPQISKAYVLEKKYVGFYNAISGYGNFDIFFSFRGSLRSKFLKFFVSAQRKYQFNDKKYNNCHQVEKYNSFINDSLNINLSAKKLKIYKKEKIINKKNRLLGINPGATYGSAKRWYPKEFAEVAIALSNDYDILIFGGAAEVDMANEIEYFLTKKNINNFSNLAGKTSIQDLISYISYLDLFVSSDSGPMHLAAAFQVPTVSIFGPTNASETSQWMNEKNAIVKRNLDCQPCMKRVCPLKHHNCMKFIKAIDVLNEVKSF